MQITYEKLLGITLIITSFILLLLMGFFYVVITFKKKQIIAKKEQELSTLNHQKNILQAQLEIQEQTFQYISQEIHDNISLSLTLAKLNLNSIHINDENKFLIESSVDQITKSLIDLNNLSKSLNAKTIEKFGLINTLEIEIENLLRNKKFDIVLNIQGDSVYLEPNKELMIFRIIQETFRNIIKHSNAKNVILNLNYFKDHLIIKIQDDGIGFDINEVENRKSRKVSAGLKNIEKRAALIQAELSIQSSPGHGTQISLNIPIIQV